MSAYTKEKNVVAIEFREEFRIHSCNVPRTSLSSQNY